MPEMMEMNEVTQPTPNRRERPADLELSEDVAPRYSSALELSTRPVVILDQLAANALADLGQAQFALEAAQTAFERSSNRNYYRSDLAHQAGVEEHTPAFQAALAEASRAAETIFQQSRNLQDATSENREPQLSDADLERANSRREFVKEDCAELPIAELRAKIQHSLQVSDVPLCWLYYRYAPTRLKESRTADTYAPQERENVRALLDSLKGRLVDTRPKGVNEKATALRKQAVAFMRTIAEAERSAFPAKRQDGGSGMF